jgi:hypothetical protein
MLKAIWDTLLDCAFVLAVLTVAFGVGIVWHKLDPPDPAQELRNLHERAVWLEGAINERRADKIRRTAEAAATKQQFAHDPALARQLGELNADLDAVNREVDEKSLAEWESDLRETRAEIDRLQRAQR